jgi:hypothetical protein
MSTTHEQDFPFNELRKPNGDYYDNRTQMERAGFAVSQMWSVTDAEGEHGEEYLCYGPVQHYINLIGYIATAEHHDGDTYYMECIKTAQEAAEEAAYFCDNCED